MTLASFQEFSAYRTLRVTWALWWLWMLLLYTLRSENNVDHEWLVLWTSSLQSTGSWQIWWQIYVQLMNTTDIVFRNFAATVCAIILCRSAQLLRSACSPYNRFLQQLSYVLPVCQRIWLSKSAITWPWLRNSTVPWCARFALTLLNWWYLKVPTSQWWRAPIQISFPNVYGDPSIHDWRVNKRSFSSDCSVVPGPLRKAPQAY